MSPRLSVRRKATRGTDVNTLVQRGEEDRILKCLCMIEDTDLREGLYVMTRGTQLGWLVGCGLTGFECLFVFDEIVVYVSYFLILSILCCRKLSIFTRYSFYISSLDKT